MMSSDDAIYAEVQAGTFPEKDVDVIKNICYEDPNGFSKSAALSSPTPSPSSGPGSSTKCVAALGVVLSALVIGLLMACLGFALEISKMNSDFAMLSKRLEILQTNTDLVAIYNLSQQIRAFDARMQELQESCNITIATVSKKLKDHIRTFDARIRDSSNATIETLTAKLNASTDALSQALTQDYSTRIEQVANLLVVSSCADLPPPAPSDYYWVRASNGSAVRVYCDMTRSCGGVTGGWVRVAELDMTNDAHQCPSGLVERNYSDIRTCVRDSAQGGCSLIAISSSDINYRSVCGRVLAYQYGSPDAMLTYMNTIDSGYVDGISLTHGNPREHIWTFAATLDEVESQGPFPSCFCIRNMHSAVPSPQFVGNDYFCDTGSRNRTQPIFYGGDPLWDGAGCGSQSTCCSFNNPPWFYKQLPQPTTDNIELRVCRNQAREDEDIAIARVEVYVK